MATQKKQAKKKAKPRKRPAREPLLVELLEKALTDSGMSCTREDKLETFPVTDYRSYLTIELPWKGDSRIEVELSFDGNRRYLRGVSVWERQREVVTTKRQLVGQSGLVNHLHEKYNRPGNLPL